MFSVLLLGDGNEGGCGEGMYIDAMGDEEYDIIKDFFASNFNVPVMEQQMEHGYKRVRK